MAKPDTVMAWGKGGRPDNDDTFEFNEAAMAWGKGGRPVNDPDFEMKGVAWGKGGRPENDPDYEPGMDDDDMMMDAAPVEMLIDDLAM